MPSTPETTPYAAIVTLVAEKARASGVFIGVEPRVGHLVCAARDAKAEYRVDLDFEGPSRCRVWVSMVTPDRWLSESVESDLLNSGDPIAELLEDELAELGWEGTGVSVEHFRSEDLLFTFRTALCFDDESVEAAATAVGCFLLAYEACFVQLGDMGGEADD